MLFLGFFAAVAATAHSACRDKSPINIPFTKKFNATGGATLKQMDRARIAHFKAGCGSGTACDVKTAVSTLFDVDATNGTVQYTASIGVGDPATDYTLIIDTGSSNTWVGAASQDTGESVSVTYGSGYFDGEEYLDAVTLASGYAITQQSISVASYAEGFSGVVGILNFYLGPEDLTYGTLSDENECIATVTQNAYSQDLIDVEEIGVSFEPTTSDSDTKGVITFGGVDSSLYTEEDVTSSSPASKYVGIEQSIQYGTESIMSSVAGIADIGTTLIHLPSFAYNKYVDYNGATYDDNIGLLKISSSDYESFDSVYLTSFEFTVNAQIWPRSLNTYIDGDSASSIYVVINDMGDDAEKAARPHLWHGLP
ncbi:acid protease [Laetiporus sulphureus 93-53]|uniref:Acid protease n=1 Tax=Laetiporus sulphureus 93-53 TaxID=1314785 RepID=A0A165BVG2_9APHY|nr:acid protease [Laetiporus sulphureus 93-53]KZT01727.1 acid protease [Laetiporus sulphureus 93-53]